MSNKGKELMSKYSFKNAKEINSKRCGRLLEIFNIQGNQNLSAIIIEDVVETLGHYHTNTDELYFCLDGTIQVKIYTPSSQVKKTYTLDKYDSLLIKKDVHHKIIDATGASLLAVCFSGWEENSEFESDVIS